ncbi:unnamed protein product [Oikopleura dioica]|uniref:Uncharacterized protein n=1 Tax=Oikopleura dioica TaxID=34765 RepID=E4Y489_OIKDI|nr:unnamed protein product [Oikopleura dioica]
MYFKDTTLKLFHNARKCHLHIRAIANLLGI